MRTIKGRIVLAIVLVGCVPLLIGLFLASMSGMRSLRDVIGGNFQEIASQAAARVTMLVDAEVQSLRLLASAPLRVRLPVMVANDSYTTDPVRASAMLQHRSAEWERTGEASYKLLHTELSLFLREKAVRDGDKMVGLLITDRHGALVATSSAPDRFLFADEAWWRTLHEGAGRIYMSDVIPAGQGSFRTPEETFDIAVPILDDHQRSIIGAVKASFRFDALFAMINAIRIGQTGHAMLFNAAGDPLICPILPRKAHRIDEALLPLIVSTQPGWGIAPDDGHGARDTVVGFAPVLNLGSPNNGWHIFVRQHPSESYAPIRQQLWNLALIGAVMIALLAGMGRYVAARIARPIQTLKQGVEAISRGTYDGPLDIRTGDEFEDLGAAVDRMAANLKASQQQLESLNQDLLRRVEEKTAEVSAQMRKLQMSERLAALGRVASGIAHEINNPLGIILNRIECIEAEAAQLPVPEELARDLSAIQVQAERIMRVTRSMLALSRGAATVLKPLDVNCIVRSAVDVAAERSAARHIAVESRLSARLPPVMGDRARLETVVLNLINNSIDAVQDRPDGRVTVTTAEEDGGRSVVLTVADNGGGIPEELLERVFDPFFTTKPVGQGNGLGLFLTYGIVTEHRGRVDARNGASGAVFTVRLPAVVVDVPVSEGV